MEYTNADVFAYQILDCLVSNYQYQIVNVPGNKKDIWLASEKHESFPMIRLSVTPSTSAIFEKEYLMNIKAALSTILKSDKPLLIMNTNQESQGFIEGDFVQVVVTSDKISSQDIVSIFPALPNALKEVENKQEECARLTRHMETMQLKKLKEARKFDIKKVPLVSAGILLFCMLVTIAATYIVFTEGSDLASSIVVSGAYYKSLVVYGGEFWRLLTTGFIHLSFIELLFYGLFLYQMGQLLEKTLGRWKYALTFMVSIIVGNICMFILDGNIIAWGMAPGLTGLVLCFLLYLWDSKLYRNRFIMSKATYLLIMVMLMATLGGTSMYSLLGGGVAGLFMGVIVLKSETMKPFKIHFMVCGLVLSIALGYLTIQVNSAYPEFREVDQKVVEGYKRIGLDTYAKRIGSIFEKAYEG